jgi:hypothetical protein
MELFAALAGTFYLVKMPLAETSTKYFVWYLWLTFLIELIGAYAPIGYFTNYEWFSFIQDKPYAQNNWLYNYYFALSFSFYPLYFSFYFRGQKLKILMRVLAVLFLIAAIVNLILSETFISEDSKFINLLGPILLFFSIALFYFELLRSNFILYLKRYLPFYLSIGLLIFYLSISPITIFSQYFNSENSLFVKLQVHLILFSNIFMYSFFILGFYICSKKKRSF